MKSTHITLRDVQLAQSSYQYRAPIKFGGRVVEDVTVLDIKSTVETEQGNVAPGLGSMPMGNAWAWPSKRYDAGETLRIVIGLTERLVGWAADAKLAGHPLDISETIRGKAFALAEEIRKVDGLEEIIPPLAVLLAVSPLEAAVFDGHGRSNGTSSYKLLGKEFVDHDLAHYLNDEFQGLYLDQFVLEQPRAQLPLYHLVGALDPLTDGDITKRLNDGRPETLHEYIEANGLTHLKIKLNGDDIDWDVDRVCRINRVADQTKGGQQKEWAYSLDFNEQCKDEAYVLELIERVKEQAPTALERVQYIEQPTHRDLEKHPENTMHRVTQQLPVVIDESLVDFASLQLARKQGYSGVALKACKGHGEALLMAAAAQHYNQFLCVQDLTCIGASLLHSASLAAHIPTVAAIESNGRQYCPAGNEAWLGSYRGMYEVEGGRVPTEQLGGVGLGYDWPNQG